MTIADAIVTVLEANAALLTTLTGGVYTITETGRNGISSVSVEDAYDPTTGILQPMATVYYRGDNLWGGGHDPAVKFDTLRGIAEIRLYDDGDQEDTAIESASDQIEALLHEEYITGAGYLKRINKFNDREPEMNNALLILLEFQVVYSRQLVP